MLVEVENSANGNVVGGKMHVSLMYVVRVALAHAKHACWLACMHSTHSSIQQQQRIKRRNEYIHVSCLHACIRLALVLHWLHCNAYSHIHAHKSSSVLLLTNLLKQQMSLCVSIRCARPFPQCIHLCIHLWKAVLCIVNCWVSDVAHLKWWWAYRAPWHGDIVIGMVW